MYYICVMALNTVSFTQNKLFDLITGTEKWWEGYTDANGARVLKHRHKTRLLSQESYDNLFFHFGYKKELIWTKS